jgi:hypothetical protein
VGAGVGYLKIRQAHWDLTYVFVARAIQIHEAFKTVQLVIPPEIEVAYVRKPDDEASG